MLPIELWASHQGGTTTRNGLVVRVDLRGAASHFATRERLTMAANLQCM